MSDGSTIEWTDATWNPKGIVINRGNADTQASNVLLIIRQIQASEATTLRAVSEALNARGIHTARGGQWYAATVRNEMKRSD